MRLYLSVYRHKLPPTNVVWSVPTTPPQTIAQLLEQVNHIIPLESGQWGLEDYTVEVKGFECLHFQSVADAFREDDNVA